MLRAVELSLIQNSQPILCEIGLQVSAGDKLAIVGANGAGKSSLLKCLAGLIKPSAGSVELRGRPLLDRTRREIAREIAYLPQQVEIWSSLTVKDFILMARYSFKGGFLGSAKSDLGVCQEALARCGMSAHWNRDLRELSGGEKQLVLIAGLLAQQANILLLDEPTTFLDLQNQHLVQAVLKELFATLKITVVCATHDLNSALLGYNRIVGLRMGRLVYDGPANKFLDNGTLISVYGRDFEKVKHPRSNSYVVLPDDFGVLPDADQI